MKSLVFSIIFIMLANTPAFARLGESVKECRRRYGKPVKIEKIQDYDNKIYYRTTLYNISILFKNNRAVVINYQSKDKAPIRFRRLEHVLHNNGKRPKGSGSTDMVNRWFFDNRANNDWQVNFIDEDKITTATYYLKSNTLSIKWIR